MEVGSKIDACSTDDDDDDRSNQGAPDDPDYHICNLASEDKCLWNSRYRDYEGCLELTREFVVWNLLEGNI